MRRLTSTRHHAGGKVVALVGQTRNVISWWEDGWICIGLLAVGEEV